MTELATIERAFDTHSNATRAVTDELQTRVSELEKLGARSAPAGFENDNRETWGNSFVGSPAFRSIASDRQATARLEVRTITTADGSAGGLIPPDHRTDPLMLVRRRLRVSDLVTQAETSSNAVTVVNQSQRQNNAAIVAEGNLKPTSEMTFQSSIVPVEVIATLLIASVQVLDDAPLLASIIDGELRYNLGIVLENQILLGDGTSNNFAGLLPNARAYAAPFAATAESPIDRIALAQAQLAGDDYEPNAVLLNPVDLIRMRLQKTADEAYVFGNPASALDPVLFGMNAVASTSVPVGTFAVGDFKRAATLFTRQDAVLEASTSHADLFAKNLVALRAEMRAALSLRDGDAIVTGSLLTA